MSNLVINTFKDQKWGNCVKLSNKKIELVAALDFGPRIMRFNFAGEENIFHEDVNFDVNNEVPEYGFKEENRKVWQNYGGHRIWVAPESDPRTYYPDNTPVEWYKKDDGIVLCPPEETKNNIKKEMQIVMHDDNNVDIIQRVKNTGMWPIKFALWGVSVMSRGGMEVISQPDRATGLLQNRVVALWPYSKMNDKRVTWGEKYITLMQDEKNISSFKFGINNEKGWAAYFNHNNLFINRYDQYIDKEYPDGGMSFESYSNNFILEMETLSPMHIFKPGEVREHTEHLALFDNVKRPDNDEKQIYEVLSKFIDMD